MSNNTNQKAKNHYTNRQLISSNSLRKNYPNQNLSSESDFDTAKRKEAKSPKRIAGDKSSLSTVTTSGGSGSASSPTGSDQLAMLGTASSNKGNQMQHMQREHMALHQQQQRQRHLQQQQHHHQHQQQQQQQQQHQRHQQQMIAASKANKLAQQAADNLTSSSSSDPSTVDDLHHFAASNHHNTITMNRHNHQFALSAGARAAAAAAAAATRSSKGASLGARGGGGGRFLLGVLFTLAELLLFVGVFLWLYWAYQHDDGLAWQNDRKQQFNLHAALMLFGFIFLSGQAMLIHRAFQCCNRIYTKIMHTILFVLATSAISLGLILAYTAQENVGANNKPIMHFYSLHAWCGLTTVGLFILQFTVGFISFLILLCCDKSTQSFRAALLPIHKTFGLIIFNLAVATCLMGLLQTARSRLSSKLNKVDYHELAESGIVINAIGVCLILLAIIMPYIIRNLDIKRTDDRSANASRSSSSSASFRSEYDRQLNKLSQYENLRV